MKLELKGEYARMTESFESLGMGLALASIHRLPADGANSCGRSRCPLIIMAAVPLGLIGRADDALGHQDDAQRGSRKWA